MHLYGWNDPGVDTPTETKNMLKEHFFFFFWKKFTFFYTTDGWIITKGRGRTGHKNPLEMSNVEAIVLIFKTIIFFFYNYYN